MEMPAAELNHPTILHLIPLLSTCPLICSYFGRCQGKIYFGIEKFGGIENGFPRRGQRKKLELGYVGPCEWVIEPFAGNFAE
jgi:hypothetical protein